MPTGSRRVGARSASPQVQAQDLNLEYIEFPLTIGYTNRFSGWESNLYIGIAISFQISCKVVLGAARATPSTATTCPGPGAQEDDGLVDSVRIRLHRDLGGSLLGLDFRYMLGLSDIFENSNIRNRSWQFTAKWAVPIGD